MTTFKCSFRKNKTSAACPSHCWSGDDQLPPTPRFHPKWFKQFQKSFTSPLVCMNMTPPGSCPIPAHRVGDLAALLVVHCICDRVSCVATQVPNVDDQQPRKTFIFLINAKGLFPCRF